MEAIIQGLQSTQVPIKAKTLEDLILKLENPKFLSNAMVIYCNIAFLSYS